MKRIVLCFLMVVSCFLGGCASLFSGSGPQAVSIMTEPANADISIVNNRSGDVISKAKSPHTAMLERKDAAFKSATYNVLLTLPGYMKEEVSIKNGTAGWFWGNIIFGYTAIVGTLIDGGTGAAFSLKNDPIKIKLYPDTLEGRMSKAMDKYNGVELLNKGDNDKAITATTTAISLYPDYVEAFCTRGTAYARKKDYEKSYNDFSKAISIKPDFPNSYCDRGNVYYKQEKLDLALADYNKALSLNSDYAEALYGRSLIYKKQNNKVNARADMELACSKGFDRACY